MAEVITEDNTREDDRNRKFYDISFEDETGLKGSGNKYYIVFIHISKYNTLKYESKKQLKMS